MKFDRLRQLLTLRSLRPQWVHRSDSPIWHLEFSGSGFIVVESRDQGSKQCRFAVLSAETGRVAAPPPAPPDPWWTGIESLTGDQLLLHGFAKPDLPEHRGIFAYDIRTGRQMWQQPDHTFWFRDASAIYTIRSGFEQRVGAALDPETGEVRHLFEESLDDMYEFRSRAMRESQGPDLRFPVPYAGEGEAPEVKRVIEKVFAGRTIVGDAEYATGSGMIVLAGHEKMRGTPDLLRNQLWVLNASDGKARFSEVLVTDAPAPVPDSFFIRDGVLYFIRNRTDLVSVRLWKS